MEGMQVCRPDMQPRYRRVGNCYTTPPKTEVIETLKVIEDMKGVFELGLPTMRSVYTSIEGLGISHTVQGQPHTRG